MKKHWFKPSGTRFAGQSAREAWREDRCMHEEHSPYGFAICSQPRTSPVHKRRKPHARQSLR